MPDVTGSLDCATNQVSDDNIMPETTDIDSQTIAAASSSFLITFGLRTPLSRVKKAGKSTGPSRPSANVPTQTPSVSRYSRVRGISKKLLQPELMTVTGVRPNSVKSANKVSTQLLHDGTKSLPEISMEISPPRCTPPIQVSDPLSKMPQDYKSTYPSHQCQIS